MALFRLAFHDCFAYKNGSGGRCDGCLNFSGMGVEAPSPFASVSTYCQHQHPRQDKTDNNGLDRLGHYLEKIYTTTDWPTTAPALTVSLKGSGKSRADLWQFAAHVALEKTIERSNFACRHDNFQRQQVPLLEGVDKELGLAFGIWKCKIKLSKPFRFRFGRSDCIPDSSLDAPYITEKEEIHDNPHENTDAILKSVKTNLKMSAKDLIALTAVHGMIHPFGMGSIGTKYNWIGSGPYLSNMYYKFLANRPTYYWNSGFDMKSSQAHNLHPHAVGDSSGKPVATWGMRVSCSDCWNTTQSTMGGPCVWRPTKANAEDCLNFGQMTKPCFDGWDENNKRKVADNNCCRDATFTPEGIQVGGKCQAFVDRTKTSGWSNSFALNYEVGLTHKFDLDPVAFRPTGCQGIELDDPTSSWANGSISNSAWLSPRADCPKQDLKDPQSGKTTSEIVEQFADDHDVWAKQFLGAWERMQRIGYTKWQLKAGPENSWMGYYPLKDMGATFSKLKRSLKIKSQKSTAIVCKLVKTRGLANTF